MRTAAAFLLTLGLTFAALLLGGLGAAPALGQDLVGTIDEDLGWFADDQGWLERDRGDALPDEQASCDAEPYGGRYGAEATDVYDEAAWLDPGPDDDDPGDARAWSVGPVDAPLDDDDLEAWFSSSDDVF